MTSSQSPRAKRESTNDPEEFAKGEVSLGLTNPRKSLNDYEPAETPDPMYEISGYEPKK